jgi:hypothetical protein
VWKGKGEAKEWKPPPPVHQNNLHQGVKIMYKVLFGAAACVLGLTLAGEAQARPFHHGHARVAHRVVVRHRAPVHRVGVRFSPSWRRVWSPVYHRYNYYDATARCYYFYDPARCGYFPCP